MKRKSLLGMLVVVCLLVLETFSPPVAQAATNPTINGSVTVASNTLSGVNFANAIVAETTLENLIANQFTNTTLDAAFATLLKDLVAETTQVLGNTTHTQSIVEPVGTASPPCSFSSTMSLPSA